MVWLMNNIRMADSPQGVVTPPSWQCRFQWRRGPCRGNSALSLLRQELFFAAAGSSATQSRASYVIRYMYQRATSRKKDASIVARRRHPSPSQLPLPTDCHGRLTGSSRQKSGSPFQAEEQKERRTRAGATPDESLHLVSARQGPAEGQPRPATPGGQGTRMARAELFYDRKRKAIQPQIDLLMGDRKLYRNKKMPAAYKEKEWHSRTIQAPGNQQAL